MKLEKRIAYLEGPGDIVAAFAAWEAGRRLQSETSVTFSSQFFDFAKNIGADAFCASYCRREARQQSPDFFVCNLPRPTLGQWHLDRVLLFFHVIRLAFRFARERRNTIYVAWGPEDLIFLGIFRLLGMSVVAILHNALWAHGNPPSGWRAKWRLFKQGLALRAFVANVLAVSPIIASQVEAQAPKLRGRIGVFTPKFYREDFPPFSPNYPAVPIQRLLFVGRIEEDKGIFVALDALGVLERRRPGQFHLTYCGSGSGMQRLQMSTRETALTGSVTLRGRLDSSAIIQAYRNADIVLAPTTRAFAEGFGMVVAEAILCGKPVVCSSVVPAAYVCSAAVIITAPDDPTTLADAVFSLANSDDLYEQKRIGCGALREQLLDSQKSFGAMLTRIDA